MGMHTMLHLQAMETHPEALLHLQAMETHPEALLHQLEVLYPLHNQPQDMRTATLVQTHHPTPHMGMKHLNQKTLMMVATCLMTIASLTKLSAEVLSER